MTPDTLAALAPGTRLRMTDAAQRCFPRRRGYEGAFLRRIQPHTRLWQAAADPDVILVHVDGYKNPERFHHSFWEVVG